MVTHSILSHSVDKVGQQWDGFGTAVSITLRRKFTRSKPMNGSVSRNVIAYLSCVCRVLWRALKHAASALRKP